MPRHPSKLFLILGLPLILTFQLSTSYAVHEMDSVTTTGTDNQPLNVENMCDGDNMKLCVKTSRLAAYKLNAATYDHSEGDEGTLEANYSFRYLITRPDCAVETGQTRLECISTWNDRYEVFFSYTGKFDFYMLSRRSGPVINRTSNPALHWRRIRPAWIEYIDWLDLAVEHRSNGQTTDFDDKDSAGNYLAQQHWLAGDHAYIDGISRSANYVSIEVNKTINLTEHKLEFWLNIKGYFDEDSQVTWGSHQGDRIWDYDLVRAMLESDWTFPGNNFVKQIKYNFEYIVGAKGFSTDSLNASLYFPALFKDRKFFPINYIRFHVGPMNELSNYTEPQFSFFVGMKLDPFPKY